MCSSLRYAYNLFMVQQNVIIKEFESWAHTLERREREGAEVSIVTLNGVLSPTDIGARSTSFFYYYYSTASLWPLV